MNPIRSSAFLTCLLLATASHLLRAQEMNGNRVRYDLNRVTVTFDAGALTAEQMGRFAVLADRGVQDIDTLLNHAGPGARLGPPVAFVVREGLPMSRTFRRTIMLPADRVRRDSAPYLHEATHVLVPMKEECLWLSEGFASYVQSYVAEKIGGYDGYVFSWGGNGNVDRLARRTLTTDLGRAALPYVGSKGQPADIFEKRREVAQPLYVLSHSLVKFMIENTSLDRMKALVEDRDIEGSAQRITGRTIEAWKADWLAMLAAEKRVGSGTSSPGTSE